MVSSERRLGLTARVFEPDGGLRPPIAALPLTVVTLASAALPPSNSSNITQAPFKAFMTAILSRHIVTFITFCSTLNRDRKKNTM